MVTAGVRRHAAAVAARARRVAVAGAAVALAAATAFPAAAAAPTAAPARAPVPAPTPPPVVVVDCFGEPQVRPEEYLLACGDGNNRLVGLRWTDWGAKTAAATGTDMVNDCRPYCAAGRFRPYPVKVTLSAPEPWPDRPGTTRFTQIRLTFPDAAPAPMPHDVTYKLVY
ncbi:hypothetical protein SUDANB120_05722 [Streptomyces sp. enrichment culture]|uniref:hypothetical protein n=1 Tax=Streptomyces TaxID=1883 RepID=UPI00167189A9|nr:MULTISPECIES: hypothetical protein [Streptomyces]MBD3575684.1 hypothetical protein [Streptomyces sp. KD18]GGT24582.1 hypothetical protein GCM10010286_57450 [Streptomyces toxytricini]